MKIAIIGAGASGMFVGGLLAKKGYDVTIFDKNDKVGKKLAITGKGRCNITNLCTVEEFLQNVVRGERFLKTALYTFNSQDCINFFESLSLKTKLERGNRVFPISDNANEVVDVLKNIHCKNVKFRLKEEVVKLEKTNKFLIFTKKGQFEFDKVIVATGGKSYSGTGSDGAGYKIAQSFGHKIIALRPALCPIKLKDTFIDVLQGVSLKNVQLNVLADGKKLGFFGEMLFTDCGISGPIVLTASSYINRCEKIELSLDFKPALSLEQLDRRILRDFENNKNKNLKNLLKGLLPKAVAEIFAEVVGLNENKKVNEITKTERQTLVKRLKDFKLNYAGLYNIDAGIITSGGVDIKQINPKTFESKLVGGLYFLGEVLDVDALTGGFNLQIAFATAYCMAKNFV